MGPRQRARYSRLCAGCGYPAGFGQAPPPAHWSKTEVLLVVLESLTFFLIFSRDRADRLLDRLPGEKPARFVDADLVAYRHADSHPDARSTIPLSLRTS